MCKLTIAHAQTLNTTHWPLIHIHVQSAERRIRSDSEADSKNKMSTLEAQPEQFTQYINGRFSKEEWSTSGVIQTEFKARIMNCMVNSFSLLYYMCMAGSFCSSGYTSTMPAWNPATLHALACFKTGPCYTRSWKSGQRAWNWVGQLQSQRPALKRARRFATKAQQIHVDET